MIGIKRFLGITAINITLMTNGCTNYTVKQLPSIPGANTSSVNLFIDNTDGSAILSGHVSRALDKRTIEEYVRTEYGYQDISNQITYD